ncbi:MAG: MBOAT family O-acyltransferase [Flavobacteriales bacterium]
MPAIEYLRAVMLLNTILFIAFLILTLDLYYQTKYRLELLLVGSIAFIGFIQWQAVPVILINIVITFLFAKKIEQGDAKHLWFISALFLILLQLLGIKMIGGNFSYSFKWIALALGLSFYALQNIAYLIEVKLKNISAETNILKYALYTSFFPKILSGPIVLYPDFKSQIDKLPSFKKSNLAEGFNRFLFGLFKKMVLADRLAPMASSVFESNEPLHGFTVLFAGFVFTLQVFFDFSAYIDMAIGIAKMFGFHLPENFNTPFKAKTIGGFWKRWNITLMEWLQHYIYLPLSFLLRQKPVLSVVIPVILTLLFSALWHGVGPTFMLWALCHILYLLIEWKAKHKQMKVPSWLAHFLCLLGVSFANIFFRAQSMEVVGKMMSEIFSFGTFIPNNWYAGFVAVFAHGGELTEFFNFLVTTLLVLLFFVFEKQITQQSSAKELNVKWLFFIISLLLIFAVFSSGEEFIYARF